jgi:hypothetical protein
MTYFSRFTSHFSHLRFLLPLLAITFLPIARIAATAEEEEATPYYGDWENAHGDKLQITSGSIQVNEEKPMRYDDITEDSDGSFFVLQLKDQSESSYFEGKFLRLAFGKDPDRFTMSVYKTLEDALKKENEVKHVEWSAPPEEDEDEPEGEPEG